MKLNPRFHAAAFAECFYFMFQTVLLVFILSESLQ